MPRINLKGESVPTVVKSCRGEGCPVLGCRMRAPRSENKCLGYREEIMVAGKPWKAWRCEYVKN
jgi:hypothetical protein